MKLKTLLLLILSALLAMTNNTLRAQEPVEISREIVSLQDGDFYLHTVQRKQTLFSIAKAYGVDQQVIVDKNPLLKERELQVKQTLLIPTTETYRRMMRATKNTATPSPLERQQQHVESVTEGKSTIAGFDDLETGKNYDTVAVVSNTAPQLLFEGRPLINVPKSGEQLKVVMLLPFGDNKNNMNDNSADFLEGALYAVGVLKAKGVNIDMSIFSTIGATDNVKSLIESGALDGAHLVIGPVYPETFEPVARWAIRKRVPVVSPLTQIEGVINPFVVQFPPVANAKYDKLKAYISNNAVNVVLINHSQYNDTAALAEFKSVMPFGVREMSYSRSNTGQDIAMKLDKDKLNILFAPVSHQGAVEDLLSKIASVNSPIKKYDLQVVGTTRWRSLGNINPELFFRTSTTYPSSYYADRSNDEVAKFYAAYAAAFNRLPSLFAMRGYDVMMIMTEEIFTSGQTALESLQNGTRIPLQMPYKFKSSNGSINNDQWVLVTHTPTYKIDLK